MFSMFSRIYKALCTILEKLKITHCDITLDLLFKLIPSSSGTVVDKVRIR